MLSTNYAACQRHDRRPPREHEMFDSDTYALIMMRDRERQFAAPGFTHRVAIALGVAKAPEFQAVPVRRSPRELLEGRLPDRISF